MRELKSSSGSRVQRCDDAESRLRGSVLCDTALRQLAIGIQNKGGEVVGVVLNVQTGCSVILAGRAKRRCVESEHRIYFFFGATRSVMVPSNIWVRSRNGKNRTLSYRERSQRPELTMFNTLILAPNVISRQIDVFPVQR